MVPGSLKGLRFNSDNVEDDVDRFRAATSTSAIQEEAWGRYVTLHDSNGKGILLRGTLKP
jgi:hypothetical protein